MNTTTKLARASLYIAALAFLGFGLLFFVAPVTLTMLTDITLPTPIALMEIRAVYGGFFIGVGLFLLVCAKRPAWLRPGLIAQAAIMGSLLVARILGLIFHGAANPFLYTLLISEAVGLVIALAALRQRPVGGAGVS